jgi:hypothetical protein
MTQFPHDQFVKEYLPELMGEYGLVNAGESVSSELREIDVFFCPNKPVPTTSETLGLLGKMAQTTCLFEVFRKPVEIHQIQECMGKLFDIQGLQRREKRKNKQILSKDEIPFLWILTPTLSANKLESFRAELNLNIWGEGVYLLPPSLKTGIVVIHQLPVNQETLWLRILGREKVQQNAIEELNNLSSNSPHRDNVIELVCNLLAMLELNQQEGNILEPEDKELVMKLSPVYLEKLAENKQLGIQEGLLQGLQLERKNMIEDILVNRFGGIDSQLEAIIPELLKLSRIQMIPLLLNLSREDLIKHFTET